MRSAIEGASPESFQVTVNAVPPGTEAPAAGLTKETSANARGGDARRQKRAADGRMVVVGTLSVK